MSKQVEFLLTELKAELQRLELWQTNAPAAEKFESTLPFCMDMLTFTEWLQWVYIARLTALVEADAALPQGAMVLPYAEEALQLEEKNNQRLLNLINQLDNLMA